MLARAARHSRFAPSPAPESAVAALFVHERDRDLPGVALPRPEIHLVVRFGPSPRDGFDVHAVGLRRTVHRKLIRGGQRTVMARLKLGTHEAILGVPASAIAGRIVALDDLWSGALTRQLFDRLAGAQDSAAAAAILDRAIAERSALAGKRAPRVQLALDACDKLTNVNASVSSVAAELGVSERQLRRVFRDAVGVSPKTFAKLSRFRRAVRAARKAEPVSWASIATRAGYYDQAHLIGEFRGIAGTTPQAFLGELRAASSIG